MRAVGDNFYSLHSLSLSSSYSHPFNPLLPFHSSLFAPFIYFLFITPPFLFSSLPLLSPYLLCLLVFFSLSVPSLASAPGSHGGHLTSEYSVSLQPDYPQAPQMKALTRFGFWLGEDSEVKTERTSLNYPNQSIPYSKQPRLCIFLSILERHSINWNHSQIKKHFMAMVSRYTLWMHRGQWLCVNSSWWCWHFN